MDYATLQRTYNARTSLHAAYWVLDALRAGETVEVQGIPVRMVPGDPDVAPGDLYVGARNTANLLTVNRIDEQNGWVFPEERGNYPFNLGECVKVDAVL